MCHGHNTTLRNWSKHLGIGQSTFMLGSWSKHLVYFGIGQSTLLGQNTFRLGNWSNDPNAWEWSSHLSTWQLGKPRLYLGSARMVISHLGTSDNHETGGPMKGIHDALTVAEKPLRSWHWMDLVNPVDSYGCLCFGVGTFLFFAVLHGSRKDTPPILRVPPTKSGVPFFVPFS